MWFYNVLDILCTITEAISIFVIAECFCVTPRFQRNVSRIIFPVAHTVIVVCLTFFTDLGALKMFVGIFAFMVLGKLCYRIVFHECIVFAEMFYMLILLPEAVVVALMSFIYNGDVTNIIGNVPVLKWELYVLTILLRSICIMITYYTLRNYHYKLQRKDVLV